MTKKRSLLQQPKPVVQRFVRLRMLRGGRLIGQNIARRISRPRIWLKERKRRKVLASTMETVVRELARAKRHGFWASCVVLNLALFFLVAERDIQEAKLDALTHPDAWRRSLCTRIILLTIHELDLDKAAGSKLRLAMTQAKIPKPLQQKVTARLSSVRAAQDNAKKSYASVRHATIAHRDPDALQQHRFITELDTLEVLRNAEAFYAGVHGFSALMSELILEIGSVRGVLGQLAARESAQATKLHTSTSGGDSGSLSSS